MSAVTDTLHYMHPDRWRRGTYVAFGSAVVVAVVTLVVAAALWTDQHGHAVKPIGPPAPAAVTVALLIWGGVAHYGAPLELPDPFAAFLVLNAAGSYLVQLIYVFLAFFALRLVWRSRETGGLWWKLPAILVGLATPILAYDGSLNPFPTYPLNRGVFIAIGLIVICFVWWLYLRARHPSRLTEAGSVADVIDPEHAPPLTPPTVEPTS